MIGSVYKIICKDENINEIYVGSSVDFKSRLSSHKCDCYNVKRNNYNSKVYQFIREHGGWDNWNMIKIIDVDCEDKSELRYYEQLYISSLNPTLNCCKSYTTEEDRKEYLKEYREQHKEKAKEYKKEYREKNKDKEKQSNKEYRENNKDKEKQRAKEYREKNKDKLKQRNKEYKEKNKDKIKEKASVKINCECGGKYTHEHKASHFKTKKHLNNLKILE